MDRPADAAMMRRALALARGRLGQTGDNPAVGCVLARDGAIIAEAATAVGGRPHAEEQAVAAAGPAALGATAYVTLEPCGERSSGATSCAERLVATGVSRVVFAASNPHRLSAGQGPAKLESAGVAVEGGFLENEALDLYKSLFRPGADS